MKRTPSGDKKRDSVFRFRLTEDEKILVKEVAKLQGFRSVSKFIRSRIKENGTAQIIDRQTLLLLHAEIGKGGSNLNQIAKAINIRMKTGEQININPDLLNGTINNIQELAKQLLELLKDVRIGKNKR